CRGDLELDSADARLLEQARREGRPTRFQDRVAVPASADGEVLATLLLHRKGGFSEREVELALTFAGQAAVALEKARLFEEVHRLACTDGLTGVANRRHFFELGELALRHAVRQDHPLAVILLDVDHFKLFNDTHGHAAGDCALQAVARACLGVLRQSDILGRIGGEEFALVLPGAGQRDAVDAAERLRSSVMEQQVEGQQVTASLGLACRREETRLGALLQRADRALYRAKAEGRNRVAIG
ncbi:MAG: sensor domain-containing diguanylate cyclase, partial [Candidatus Eremiobacterota bacterium]